MLYREDKTEQEIRSVQFRSELKSVSQSVVNHKRSQSYHELVSELVSSSECTKNEFTRQDSRSCQCQAVLSDCYLCWL
jgi:hypothetical protein